MQKKSEDDSPEDNNEVESEKSKMEEPKTEESDHESEIEDAIEVEEDEDDDDDENLEEILQAEIIRKNTGKNSNMPSVESEIVTAPSGEKFEFTFYPANAKGEKSQNLDGNEFEIECVESMEEESDGPGIPDISVKQEKNDVTVKMSDDDVMPNLESRCFCQYPGCVHFKAGQRTYRCPRCSERLGSLGDYIRNRVNNFLCHLQPARHVNLSVSGSLIDSKKSHE